MSDELRIHLIAGLGNPGREYEGTRHNVGFMIVDRLAKRTGAAFRPMPKWKSHVAALDGVYLCKPGTFMNCSGEPIAALAHFYKIPPEQILAVYDDAALPLGRLRLRAQGSAGGHNGMKSILQHVGDTPRMRFGIGAAPGEAMTGHVLGKFRPDELPALEQALDRGVEALECVCEQGLAAAMNRFNQDPL